MKVELYAIDRYTPEGFKFRRYAFWPLWKRKLEYKDLHGNATEWDLEAGRVAVLDVNRTATLLGSNLVFDDDTCLFPDELYVLVRDGSHPAFGKLEDYGIVGVPPEVWGPSPSE